MPKSSFFLILSTALGLLCATPSYSMDDDLFSDMGMDLEEVEQVAPTPQAPVQTQPAPAPAPTPQQTKPQSSPTARSTAKAPPSSKKKQKKKVASHIDLITRIKSGMDFNTEEIEEWVMSGNDINKCMENGKTLLLYLVTKYTDTEAVRFLIEKGADVQTHCSPRYDALFVAVKENKYVPMIETLINNNANIVDTDLDGNNALILTATYNTNPEIIDTLLEFGLKVDTKNHFGYDALTLAVYNNGRIPMIQKLLENGADINATDNEGHTPLMAASILGNDMLMQYLIKQGADFNATDKMGVSVLEYYNKRVHLASKDFKQNPYASVSEKLQNAYKFIAESYFKYNNALLQSFYQPNASEALKDALLNYADVELTDPKGCTPILNATMYGLDVSAIKLLLEKEAEVNATCLENQNALMMLFSPANNTTSISDQIEKINLLADAGIAPNMQDTKGNTSLHYATATNASKEIIQTLINIGADINQENNYGQTALILALSSHAPEQTIKTLLENNANPNHKDKNGNSPLWLALSTEENQNLVPILLEYGANVEEPNKEGILPIWYALTRPSNEETLRHIISAVPNINLVNQDKDTPLLYALKQNASPTLIEMLIQNGADPKIRGNDGRDAYDILKSNRYFNEAVKRRTKEQSKLRD